MAARYAVVLAAMVSLGTTGAATGATPEACDPLDYVQPAPIALDIETVTATHILEGRFRRAGAGPAENEKDLPPPKADKTTPAPKPEPVATAFGYPLSAAEAEAALPLVRRLLKVNHSEYQKRTLILSAIMPDRFEAYLACRKQKGFRLTVELPERIAARAEYFLRLHWHPSLPYEGDAALTLVTAGATVSEGHYAGDTRTKPQEFRIKPDAVIILKVARTNETRDSEIVGSVGGDAFRIEVPAVPTQRLIGEVIPGTAFKLPVSDDCEPPVATSCVAGTMEFPLLPGSFRWKTPIGDRLENVVSFKTDIGRIETDLQICRSVAYKCQRPYGASWSIDRIGTAVQLKTASP